jgi:hypothetical protein
MKNLPPSFIVLFVVSMLAAFFLGRWTAPKSIDNVPVEVGKDLVEIDKVKPKSPVKENTEADKDTQVLLDKKVIEEDNPGTVVTSELNIPPTNTQAPENPTTATEQIATRSINPQSTIQTSLPRVKMGISDKKIGETLTAIAENLEDKKLVYNSKLMQDCSGIFHQMKDSLQKRIPVLSKIQGKFQYPSSKNIRNTRQIADWYFKNNNLLIVEDAMAARNSIRPGAVMFYGKSNKKFTNIDIDMLTDRDNNYTSNGAIMHIAVVTAVTTDEEGNVINYTIMHGRNPRNHASRTGSKAVQSKRTKGLPPFGNWSQQLVAIANIATPES